jgi:hypothetical protein
LQFTQSNIIEYSSVVNKNDYWYMQQDEWISKYLFWMIPAYKSLENSNWSVGIEIK